MIEETEDSVHSDHNLTKCFVELIKYLKTPYRAPLDHTHINIAIGTALGGLGYGFNPYEVVTNMADALKEAASIMDIYSKRAFLNKQVHSGKENLKAPANTDKAYSVAEVAKISRVGEEAIRKAIRAGKLNAYKKNNKEYEISQVELDRYLGMKKK